MGLQEFKDTLAKGMFGMSKDEAIEKGICVKCKEEALPKCYSQAGVKEYYISGLCEECFDKIFE